jgi:hypothetical protein
MACDRNMSEREKGVFHSLFYEFEGVLFCHIFGHHATAAPVIFLFIITA